MARNEMQWSSATPGLLVIMVDQSGSMTLDYEGGDTRSEFAAKAVNRVINTLIQKNFDGKAPKDRCYVAVIGYDADVKVLASGFLKELESSPKRIANVTKKVSNGEGGVIEVDTKMPIWIEPIYEDSCTNMMGAFAVVNDLVANWIKDKPNYPAPVVINISDGLPYDGREIEECMYETINIVNKLKEQNTADGKVQIFNAMIGEGNKVVFPKSTTELDSVEAQFLYEISTEIPEAYKGAAEKNELKFEMGARGAIYNADAEHLIKLIDFGSSKGQGDK